MGKCYDKQKMEIHSGFSLRVVLAFLIIASHLLPSSCDQFQPLQRVFFRQNPKAAGSTPSAAFRERTIRLSRYAFSQASS